MGYDKSSNQGNNPNRQNPQGTQQDKHQRPGSTTGGQGHSTGTQQGGKPTDRSGSNNPGSNRP